MVPVPSVTSAKPLAWANRAPARATSALLSAMPRQVTAPTRMPCASAMRGLTPVARIASPSSLARNRTSKAAHTATSTSSTRGRTQAIGRPSCSNGVSTVVSPSSAMFGRPMMRRLIE